MTTIITPYDQEIIRRLLRAADTADIDRREIRIVASGVAIPDDLVSPFEDDLANLDAPVIDCPGFGPCQTGPCVPNPTLTSLDPVSGTDDGDGMDVTLTGTNFTASSVVYFDAIEVPSTFVDATELTAHIPASLLSGVYSVTVRNGGEVSGGQTFTYLPAITSLTPDTEATGNLPVEVVIAGFGFGPTSTVEIDGTPVTGITVDSTTSITFDFPASAADTYDVTVVHDGAESAAAVFTVTA